MNKLKATFVLCLSSIFAFSANAMQEVEHEKILSFEEEVAPIEAVSDSEISLSAEHYKHKKKSLKWSWDKRGAQIRIKEPIGYLSKNPNSKETSVSTFIFWVYAKQPVGGDLKFEFLKDGEVCSWFIFNNNFKGWRGGWVAFDRDMEGVPSEDMDELVITANSDAGEVYLDHFILSTFIDIRHHTAGFQLPKVNPTTKNHWLILLKSWQNKMDMPIAASISQSEKQGMDIITERLKSLMLKGGASLNIEEAREAYKSYGIVENPDGTVRGKSIFFGRYSETYDALFSPNNIANLYAKNGQLVRRYNDLMYNIAVLYNKSSDNAERSELADMYTMMTRHLLEQGFAAGSELGTLHHLGYSMKNFYTAPILMKEVLTEAQLDGEIQQAMEWFSGTGEIKPNPAKPGIDIDTFNTTLIGRIASVIMLADSPYKVAYLKSLTRWLDNGYKITEGLAACFKSDGSLTHHRKHYAPYAVGGFEGAAQGIWLLHDTEFAISKESHQIMKSALLHMRFYSNLHSFPITMSGRHPDGTWTLAPMQYLMLAQAGTPDGKEEIDSELIGAYMRLMPKQDKIRQEYEAKGYKPESHPQGTNFYAYNSSMSHRRDNWLITVMGHSRYLWASEHYNNANYYGRYLSHGSLIFLGGDDDKPVTQLNSGFKQEGWDWSHIPGTTAAARPIKELEAVVLNVDTYSGREEMLMSDESFAGGVTNRGVNGLYSMKLHEHDKYNGTLRANKSFFMFDNRVVAIGTGVENNLKNRPAHTTLFQTYTGDGVKGMSFNGEAVTPDYQKSINGKAVIVDNLNNAYIVANGDVTVTCGVQHSLHEERRTPTQNRFAVGYINHGDIVKDGSYEYLMLVDAESEDINRFSKKAPYKVIEASQKAHIVYDKPSQTTAYALFVAGAVDSDIVKSTSIPSVVMVSKEGGDMVVSVADPDLRLYEGESDEIFDKDGKRVERSIYSRDWKDNASIESTLELVIKGKWSITEGDKEFCKARVVGRNTTLTFKCRESKSREVRVTPL